MVCQVPGGAASRATKQELAGSYDDAFASYITAAQGYLFLLRHTADAGTRDRMRTLSNKLVERAERIKQAKKIDPQIRATNALAIEAQDAVLAGGSKINGLRLERWTSQHERGSTITRSLPPPELSQVQHAAGCSWVKASRVLPNAAIFDQSPSELKGGRSIVQDNISDCSIVTALIVAAEHHQRFGSRLGLSCLYPQNLAGLPCPPHDGQHRVRLLVNGGWRCIPIDDTLPVTAEGRPMCAIDRHERELWPALLEKAYLTLAGSYDFAGSNSANDLYMMSGWLPEHVSLRQSFRSQRTWQRIKKGFWMGKCVLTLGTPQKLPERQEYDLIPSHSYAVIDLLEGDDGGRHVVLANPWRTSPAASTAESPPESATAGEPQTMRLDWDILPVYFDAIHINWDPATFDHSQTVHLNVDGPSQPTTSTENRHSRRLRLNVQKRTSKPSEIWLLLARHSSCLVEKDEFMSLQVNALSTAAGQATEEQAPAGAEASSMTDDPFELYRFLPEEGATTFDINVLHEGPSPVFGFSLTALSDHRLELHDGPPALPYHKEVSGAWTAATAGGNHTCASFYRNPQYSVKLSTPPRTEQKEQRLEIEAETDRAASVNVRVLYADGRRVDYFEGRDVLAGKSTYNYGRDAATREGLDPGTYTLVVSSYQPGHLGSFKLSIRSSMPLNVTSIPAEGAGLFSRKFEGAWTPGQAGGSVRPLENPRVRLRLSGPGQVRVRLQTPEKPLPVAVTICSLNEAGSLTRVVGTSGPHVDYPGGTVIRGLQLTEADHDYVIIPSTQRPEEHVPFTLLVYADVRFELVPL